MKKYLSLFLVLVMLCSLMSGCVTTPPDNTTASNDGTASGTEPSGTTSPTETTAPPEPTSPVDIVEEERTKHDLGGKEIVIAVYDHTLFSWTEGESEYGDAVLQRIKDVEAELNCILSFKQVDPSTMLTDLAAAQLTGDKYADIIAPILWNTASFMSGDMLTDMNDIPNLDLTKKYWNKDGGTAFGLVGDTQYFAVCPMVQMEEYSWTIAFNTRILAECGLESPYDLMEKGEWTLSKMRQMALAATKETNGIGGMTAEDQWGMAAVDKVGVLGLGIMAAKGANFITENSNGDLAYAMNTTKVKDALSYTRDWLNNDNSIYSGTREETRDVWALGHSLFYCYMLKDVQEYSKTMDDDWGIVPFPKDDEADTYSMEMEWNRPVLAVPNGLSDEDLADVGLVLDALAYHSQKEYAAKWKEYKDRYCLDDESKAVIDNIFAYTAYNYSQLVAGPGNPELQNCSYNVYYNIMQQPNLSITDSIAEVVDAGKQAMLAFLQLVE